MKTLQRAFQRVLSSLAAAGLLVANMACAAQPASAQKENCDIILIVLDTIRWDSTSLSQSGENETPFLEQIANDAILFTKAYSTHDNTIYSHFSMLTGFHDGLLTKIDQPQNSVVNHLKQAGYHTIGVTANGVLRQSTTNVCQPFDDYTDLWLDSWNHWGPFEKDIRATLNRFNAPRTTWLVNNIAVRAPNTIKALEKALDRADNDKPKFIFINLFDAHDPYFPPPEFYDIEKEPIVFDFYSDLRSRLITPWNTLVDDKIQLDALHQKLKSVSGRKWSLSIDLKEEQLRLYKERYKGGIRYLDHELRNLFDVLKSRGLYEESLIIVTSDHGESFGEAGFITHAMSEQGDYEVMHHVPLLILPEKRTFDGPLIVDEKISLADLTPTIHDVLGLAHDSDPAKLEITFPYGHSLKRFAEPYFHSRTNSLRFPIAVEEVAQGLSEELEETLRSVGYVE